MWQAMSPWHHGVRNLVGPNDRLGYPGTTNEFVFDQTPLPLRRDIATAKVPHSAPNSAVMSIANAHAA